jgi:hypothetical protein
MGGSGSGTVQTITDPDPGGPKTYPDPEHCRTGRSVVMQCMACLPKRSIIKGHVSSLNNLRSHMQRVHGPLFQQFQYAAAIGSARGKRRNKRYVRTCCVQCCGSGMFIPDPNFPGSTSKNLSILTQKNSF